MNYPGEYPGALQRVTTVNVPVISGYVTARLQVQGSPEISVSGFVPNTTQVAVENTGANQVSFNLQETDDYTSGPREWVGGAVSLVPSGGTIYTVTPRQNYLELMGTSGTSFVRMQLVSRLKWDELAFAKTDPYYPPGLYQARDPLTTAV